MTKWESEKHKSWCTPAEGFMGHRCHGSLLGTAGKWGACDWAVVQLDYDEEMEPLHGMYGSMEAELEVHREIERAELTAFLCLLKKVIGPVKGHVDNKGILDVLCRGEREGNEKADERAKEGAMLDKGFMAEARAKTMQQEREEAYAALQYAASFHCLVEDW